MVLLLGPPRALQGDQDVSFDTRKAIALLSYLVVTGAAHSRDKLAGLMWPDYSQVNARAALRRTLSAMNRVLDGDSFFLATHDSLALNPAAAIKADVVEFRQQLARYRAHEHDGAAICERCLELLQSAVDLYRDDFLAGFTLRDSAPFDEWQLLQTEALQRELGGALAGLTDIHSSLGDFAAAKLSCRRWLALDRLNEVAWRKLMLLYAWSDRPAAAISQYRECVQVLQCELGVAPLAETTTLYEAIKSHNVPAPPTLIDAQADKAAPVFNGLASGSEIQPANAAPTSLPLMERQSELSQLSAAYGRVGPDGFLMALTGEAGIGKTRLAEEFIVQARAQGASALVGRCFEGEQDLAYGPVAALLRDALSLPGAAAVERLAPVWQLEVARLLPELAPPGRGQAPVLDNPGAQARFFEGVRQLVQILGAGPAPGVLFFDDLQWADSATLDLLAYLTRRVKDFPLFTILAWRSAAETPSASHDRRLERLLGEARRLNNLTVLQLARLSAAAVRELLGALPGPTNMAPNGLAERLYAETEGLPFFVTQYLAMLARGEAPAGIGWSLPGTVRDLLYSRLRSVQETGWQLLSAAAVIGRSFDFDTLRGASGRSEEEVVAGLEELIGAGLVVEADADIAATPSYDFSHDKLRALVYEETSLARRRLLHRRVAEALLGRQNQARGAGSVAGQVAHHYQLAGNETLAAEYHKLAGEQAHRLYANREALAHLETALALGHPEAGELHLAIGDLHTLLGEYKAAINSFDAAAAHLTASFSGQIERRLGIVYGRRGQWELAENSLSAALAAFLQAGQPASAAQVVTDWSLTALQRGAVEQAQELARRGVELAAIADDTLAQARAFNALGVIAARLGDNAAARGYLEQSLALAEHWGDLEARAAALNNLALAHGAAGETERALLLEDAALQLCVARGDRHHEAAIHNNIADILHAAGRSAEALAHVTQAVTILGEIGAEAGDLQPAIWRLAEW